MRGRPDAVPQWSLEKILRADDGNGAWGYFEAVVTAPPAYEGLATLQIGDRGPDDGSSARTEVPVFFGVGRDE